MPFTSRMYARTEDRDRVAAFLAEAVAEGGGEPRPGYWHPGDLTWGMYQNTVFNPKTSLRLWEDATSGALLGTAWLESRGEAGEVVLQIPPRIRATDEGAEIVAQALAWARRVAARRHVTRLWALALDSDRWQIALLEAKGERQRAVAFGTTITPMRPASTAACSSPGCVPGASHRL